MTQPLINQLHDDLTEVLDAALALSTDKHEQHHINNLLRHLSICRTLWTNNLELRANASIYDDPRPDTDHRGYPYVPYRRRYSPPTGKDRAGDVDPEDRR